MALIESQKEIPAVWIREQFLRICAVEVRGFFARRTYLSVFLSIKDLIYTFDRAESAR